MMANEGPRVVLKWPMPKAVMDFDMPADAQVIDVATQHDLPTLWTLSSQFGPRRQRTFLRQGTGAPFEEDAVYVGTAHGVDDWLVFHIFERVDGDKDEAQERTT